MRRRWPWLVGAIQLGVLLAWVAYQWPTYAYTWDFAIYAQAATRFAHGDLNPWSTLLGYRFWQNDAEAIWLPVGLLLAVGRSLLLLPVLQAVALAATTAIAAAWVDDVTADLPPARRRALRGAAAVMLLATPWTYWAAAFDVHTEPLVLPFAVWAGRLLWARRTRRALGPLALTLLGGHVAATYGIGLGVLAALRGRWRAGAAIAVGSLAALVGMERLVPGGIRGGNLAQTYAYLLPPHAPPTILSLALGLVTHAGPAAAVLAAHALNAYATIAPAGLVGLLTPAGLGVPLAVLLADNLIPGRTGLAFGAPTVFQNLPAVPFVLVGTLALLAAGVRRRPGWGWDVLAGILAANACAWAAVWLPPLPARQAGITPAAARVLARVDRAIRPLPGLEVVATNAAVGRFAAHQAVYVFATTHHPLPVRARTVLVLLTLHQGIVLSPDPIELARLGVVAAWPSVRLLAHGSGIWAFLWTPPPGTPTLPLTRSSPLVPAWGLSHPAGRLALQGPARSWRVISTHPGVVVTGLTAAFPPGRLWAAVQYTSRRPLTLTVEDDAVGQPLLVTALPPTGPPGRVVWRSFSVPTARPVPPTAGWGIWRIAPVPPPPGTLLTLSVTAPAAGAQIQAVALTPTRSVEPARVAGH